MGTCVIRGLSGRLTRRLAILVQIVLLIQVTACGSGGSSVISGPPQVPAPILPPTPTSAGCIIQSDFKNGDHGNFETVVLEGHNLVHYWHDNADVRYAWHKGQIITTNATGPGCIIQSDFTSGEHGNFEVIVPEGNNLVHYWHDNSDVTSPWQRGQIISTHVTGGGCIIQSDFISGGHGNFEVVALEGGNLVHYFHDNSNVNNPWTRAQTITTHATGPGCIIQSDFKSGGHGNFEVVVPEGYSLVHYFHDNSDVNKPWTRAQTITVNATGPASIIQSDFKSGDHGNFEVVVPQGPNLVHYFHDNSDVNKPWTQAQTISNQVNGPAYIMQSDFKSGDHGNFEVVAFENGQVQHYFHDNSDVNLPWRKGQIITYTGRSQKVCQLTGETDLEDEHATINQTATNASVTGTDLGFPVEHDGHLFFLFGDTAGSTGDGRDSIAMTDDTNPEACVHLHFLLDGPQHFQPVTIPGVSMGYFEVPTSGFSANGHLYMFVWTDHRDTGTQDSNGNEIFYPSQTGHSLLARSDDDGRTFHSVYKDLGQHFIYLAPAVVNNADYPGLPSQSGQGVLIWGAGQYRASDPYLAWAPVSDVENKAAVRYFTGLNGSGQPQWSANPDAAAPLFHQPCFGEMSSTWNSYLHEWLLLYNCDNPAGINARAARAPWGPYSDPAVLFDAWQDSGYCHFMHAAQAPSEAEPHHCDAVDDPNSPGHGGYGGVYAPYVITRFTTGDAHSTTIYYTMSTWNPYDVVLMRCTLSLGNG